MKRARALLLLLALGACSKAPMPPPAPGDTSPQDAMAPADVSAGAMTNPRAALPPPAMQRVEPVANDLGSATADGWVGTWQGPEGTSLSITKQEVGYEITISNLDGPRTFHGVAADEVLQFDRDGVTETLYASDGVATGMKWLAERKNCLVVKSGEGYCRD